MTIDNGICPFCGSSFYFREDTGRFTCFSCFASGNNPEIMMTGDLKEPGRSEILEDACKMFQDNLYMGKNMYYLRKRGINKDTIETFRLGFADGNLRSKLSGRYSDEELKAAGLIKTVKGETYDVFRNRIMFPILSPTKSMLQASEED